MGTGDENDRFDWTKGRHSKIDDLNGPVAAEATRLSHRAPVNAAITELAHRIERSDLKPDPVNLDPLRDLAER